MVLYFLSFSWWADDRIDNIFVILSSNGIGIDRGIKQNDITFHPTPP